MVRRCRVTVGWAEAPDWPTVITGPPPLMVAVPLLGPVRVTVLPMVMPPAKEPVPVAARLMMSPRKAQARAAGMVRKELLLLFAEQAMESLPERLTYQVA